MSFFSKKKECSQLVCTLHSGFVGIIVNLPTCSRHYDTLIVIVAHLLATISITADNSYSAIIAQHYADNS